MKGLIAIIISIISLSLSAQETVQRIETFANVQYTINGDGSDKQVVGTSGVTYIQGLSTKPAEVTGANRINGNGMIIRINKEVPGWIEFPLDKGVDNLKFYCVRAFNSGEAAIEVSLAGQSIQKTGVIGVIDSVVFENLNYQKPSKLRIDIMPNSATIVIDSIVWTEFVDIKQEIDTTRFTVKANNELFDISEYLVGMHSVYYYDQDSIYEDGTYAQWMKEAGVPTMRFPGGGSVKEWDWQNPSGYPNTDPWDPAWNPDNQLDPSLWTSLDEYLDIVDASGITPLFGVNITSGYVYDKEQESIDRAVAMLEYVMSKGHSGAFWYLGNEGGNGGSDSEAGIYKRHVEAMKAVDPNLKCMFNQNNLTKAYLQEYLAIAGNTVDIAETHGKWPYGGDPDGFEPGTFAEWQTERPLRDRKNGNVATGGRIWRHAANELRDHAAMLGYPDMMIANNEYGLGKGRNMSGFGRYTKNLVVIDMLQEHFIGNWDMACYWTTVRSNNDEEGVVAFQSGRRLNAMHYGFELLAKAQGGEMLQMLDDDDSSTYGFAAKKEGEYLLYLINKSSHETVANITFDADSILDVVESKTLVSTLDEFGELVTTNVDSISENHFQITLPPLSYSRFTYNSTDSASSTSSVKEWPDVTIKLYPNPSSGLVYISGCKVEYAEIFNLMGQKQRTVVVTDNQVDLTSMPQGTYMVKLTSKGGKVFVKPIILN